MLALCSHNWFHKCMSVLSNVSGQLNEAQTQHYEVGVGAMVEGVKTFEPGAYGALDTGAKEFGPQVEAVRTAADQLSNLTAALGGSVATLLATAQGRQENIVRQNEAVGGFTEKVTSGNSLVDGTLNTQAQNQPQIIAMRAACEQLGEHTKLLGGDVQELDTSLGGLIAALTAAKTKVDLATAAAAEVSKFLVEAEAPAAEVATKGAATTARAEAYGKDVAAIDDKVAAYVEPKNVYVQLLGA